MSKLKSGMAAPVSAQYEVVGPRGGHITEVTVPKGHTLPPTQKPNQSYIIGDRTNNKSGRG